MRKNNRYTTIAAVLFLSVLKIHAQDRIAAFPLSDVRLLESPFKRACQTDLNYILSLDPDRLLAPFLREAGLKPKAQSYGNWENTGLDGHIGGHYLSALSNMYAATHNAEARRRLIYMIDELEKCQRENGNGYVGGIPGSKKFWTDLAAGKIEAGGFSLNGKWVPWYNMHKLFAGLIDAYRLTGIEKAKEILIKLSEWCFLTTRQLDDAQLQNMLRCEQGGMNEALADIAGITGDHRYLQLAERFSHRLILDPLLKRVDSLTGLHANTQIPKVIGFMRIAEISGDTSWAGAAAFFWQTVVKNRTVSFGGNSVREHFNPADDFSSMLESREGPETCNSYNMLKLSKHLFLQHPLAGYMDYYERTLYNHILSSQHPDGGFVYFTPIRPRHYRVYSRAQQDFWCCVGSGMENHGKYGEMIYAHSSQDLYVNLFIPSVLTWKEKGLQLTQQTAFPYQEKSSFRLSLKNAGRFSFHIRKPSWIPGSRMTVTINGKRTALSADEHDYLSIHRLWKNGDVITVELPMHTTAEQLPDGTPWVSFVHGPVVLAAITDTTGLTGQYSDGSRSGHIANGPLYPLEEAPVFIGSKNELDQRIVPVRPSSLQFTIKDSIYPARYRLLKLVPFFSVHNARYIVYWPYTSQSGLQKRKEQIRVADSLKQQLERSTIDRILPGEQQPEADHNFQGEKTETGLHNGRHWRHATGWFSYDLKNTTKDARKIRVTYWGEDRGREFDIFINDRLVTRVHLEGKDGPLFIDKDYALQETGQPAVLNIRFKAAGGSTAGGIYEIRLLR
ncbi:glycoside hydrolase family 127 protein [Niabella beijingensis]|uniref:glycoside hydrolase family 127 protein n=1 Tax=Niabella beijingensis TaxID=2872700 RepID=UPI001CBD34AB|nr:glycoside hydrolase family 127 protein [Niabella beijingensis]MBZ4192202.1 glycoside hydrolase family 127 protein [Niabella beijingensis]